MHRRRPGLSREPHRERDIFEPERLVFGQFQRNKFTLAEIATEVQIARVLVDRCVQLHGTGRSSQSLQYKTLLS